MTTLWLGLSAAVGILLIFDIVRKGMTILMLAVLSGTTDFGSITTPVQLIVLALVTMIYIPCLSLILALASEFGWKDAIKMTVAEVAMAIVIGGVAFRLLGLIV